MRQRNPRSRDELKAALDVQHLALRASAKSYDEGNWWEALRLATTVYNLVHDHGSIRSILSQLGVRGALRFYSTGRPYNARNLLREMPLVGVRMYQASGDAEYIPLLGDTPEPHRRVQFPHWWEEIVLAEGERFQLTRKRLVFILRNQEGGGHYSEEMNDPSYLRFSKEHLTTPYVLAEGKQPKPILGVELATMRQIAWEVSRTLDDHGQIA